MEQFYLYVALLLFGSTYLSLLPIVHANQDRIYTIISDLEPLLETQKDVIINLEHIILERKSFLNLVKKQLENFEKEHKKLTKDVNNYFGNPINSYTLIKKMKIDFENIKIASNEVIEFKRNKSLKYPCHDDFVEAADSLIRLQKVYDLNITEIAHGILNTSYSGNKKRHVEFFLPMTSSDCYEMSKIANKTKLQKKRLLWLTEALRIYGEEKSGQSISEFEIIQAICDAYDAIEDSENFLKWMDNFTILKPSYDDKAIQLKIKAHKTRLQQKNYKLHIKKQKKKKAVIIPVNELEPCLRGLDRKAFRMLCRNEVSVPHEISKRLKCSYFEGQHPFTRLAPFRVEQLYIKPDVFLFYNVLSDKEIETIKHMALPKLVVTESMSYRLCKGMQIYENQTSPIKQVGQRISDFTGLVTTATMMAVSNYGVGGHYVTHMDSSTIPQNNKDNYAWREILDEILSEVVQGGATVFPALGLTVFPVKGAALYWTNLLPSGCADYTTCHGACPVLRGSKWVATKWIVNENQELKKPCIDEITSRKVEDIPIPLIKQR